MATTADINTKIGEVENKIPDVNDLVNKTDDDAKISDIEGKYFTTSDCNKFTSNILDAKIKQKELVSKSNISKFAKNFDLNTKTGTLWTKSELKAVQDKIMKLQTNDLRFFLGKNYHDISQNIFVYKPEFNTSKLKKNSRALTRHQRGVYNSVLPPQHTAFFHNIKIYGYRTGIKFLITVL